MVRQQDVSMVRVLDVPLVRLYDVSCKSQIKHSITSLWYFSITSQSYVVSRSLLRFQVTLSLPPSGRPAKKIRLDEDVLKASFVFVFRRRLQDFFKTNIFTLHLRLHKTSSRRLQDVLIKTNIFVLVMRLQDVFKTSLRRLAKTSSRHLKTSC